MSPAQRWSARLALGFAVFLAVAEVVRNWGDWGYWPFWLVDYIAVALLLVGAARSLRGRAGGTRWLAGGWGFACAMFYGSFFSHLASLRAAPDAPDHGPVEHTLLTWIIGVLFALTIAGFALSLTGGRSRSSAAS